MNPYITPFILVEESLMDKDQLSNHQPEAMPLVLVPLSLWRAF